MRLNLKFLKISSLNLLVMMRLGLDPQVPKKSSLNLLALVRLDCNLQNHLEFADSLFDSTRCQFKSSISLGPQVLNLAPMESSVSQLSNDPVFVSFGYQ